MQVTGKLKNPCDSLLTDDSAECKEQKSKLDLISRADAIEAVRLGTSKLGRGLLGKGDILDIIEALPSAEAVQGEWIFNAYEKTNKSWFECSVCGSDYFHKHNFCPHCGAKMKGGDDE